MAKKLMALVMVISVFGAFLAGCGQKAEDPAAAPKEGAAADTKGADAPKTP